MAQLNTGVADARARNSSLLAPEQFKKTVALLDTAIEKAQVGEKDKANDAASRGLEELLSLNQMVETNGRVMEEVMTTRARADEHGAPGLFNSDFKNADMALCEATRLLENNQHTEAADRRSALIQTYADLELRALKKGLAAAAADAISNAKQAGADDFAPKTLTLAAQELKLVTSVLEADRTQIEKSNAHAKKAIWLARRAQEITSTAKWFREQDFNSEDVILWYQGQLQQVRQPMTSGPLPFDRSNAEVITALREDVTSVVNSTHDLHKANRLSQKRIQYLEQQLTEQVIARRQELETILGEHEKQLSALRSGNQSQIQQAKIAATQQVAELQKKLSRETMELEEAARREREAQARYEDVRAMFGPEEAVVFRQGANVLIRMNGFQFRPGKSEIDSKNFPLLNKVLWALNIFPNGRVTVSGHTDSMGNTKNNLELSGERANGVAQFLTTVGGFSPTQLTVEGRGESEPIASNETPDGRAENRRIDVLIVN